MSRCVFMWCELIYDEVLMSVDWSDAVACDSCQWSLEQSTKQCSINAVWWADEHLRLIAMLKKNKGNILLMLCCETQCSLSVMISLCLSLWGLSAWKSFLFYMLMSVNVVAALHRKPLFSPSCGMSASAAQSLMFSAFIHTRQKEKNRQTNRTSRITRIFQCVITHRLHITGFSF